MQKLKKWKNELRNSTLNRNSWKPKKRPSKIESVNRTVRRTKRLIEKGAILEKFQGKGADKISADDSLTALVQLQNDFDSLKAFTSNVKYRKKNPDDPTRTVYSDWEEQQN